MTLSDLATFSTAISGLAVTASLIYLAMQTHQNAKHTKALIFQGRAERISNQYLTMADPSLSAAYIVGNGGTATPEAIMRHQFQQQCTAFAIGWQDTFRQHQDGLLDDRFFEGFTESIQHVLKTQPGTREYFRFLPLAAHRDFAAYMRERVAAADRLAEAPPSVPDEAGPE